MVERNFKIWRGDSKGGDFVNYKVSVDEGMVVLDTFLADVLWHSGHSTITLSAGTKDTPETNS